MYIIFMSSIVFRSGAHVVAILESPEFDLIRWYRPGYSKLGFSVRVLSGAQRFWHDFRVLATVLVSSLSFEVA